MQGLSVGAVILAAGRGSRIGHRPKCLLELDGVPLIRRLLTALADAGVPERVVVLGHYAQDIERALRDVSVTVVHNPDPNLGQVSSQRLGLAALSRKSGALLVALADQPLLDAQDIRALLTAFEQRAQGIDVVVPQVHGQRGNPVAFSAEVHAQILEAGPEVGCRQWQDQNRAAVSEFVTDNPNYRIDIDTEEDLAAFKRRTGKQLLWPATPTL